MSIWIRFKALLKDHFDLKMDKANEFETIESIKRGIEFKGTNLWVLVFAIFIASLGLNTNSTAVIIGAMLISPLMGPIMGIGLSMGIYDFDLLKRSFRNFLFATGVSLAASTLYFFLSPLSDARSELLARTMPTIYDVLIALFGGWAGIVAASSREKGNVIPGVAIATALMPPLCTAGYGLASGNLGYFFGAFYLYFINTVFISWATFLGARFFQFPKKTFINPDREKKVTRYIWIIVIVTLTPSVYLGYKLLRENIFENSVNKFIAEQLDFPNTKVIRKEIINTDDKKEIEIMLLGDEVPQASIDIARNRMSQYGLDKDITLIVQQSAKGDYTDVHTLKSMVLEDLYKQSEERIRQQGAKIDELTKTLDLHTQFDNLSYSIAPELKVLFPDISEISFATSTKTNVESMKKSSVLLVLIKAKNPINDTEHKKLEDWLKARTNSKVLQIIIQP